MPVNVSWANDTPQYWSTYLPQESDYETTDDYLKAMADASRAYYEDSNPIGQYWDPIGQVTRGGAQTEVEQGLRKLQHKFANIGKDPLNSMGLESWIRNNADLARAGYGAFDELGNPVLDRSVLALIERVLGIEGAPTPPAAAPETPANPNPRVVNIPEPKTDHIQGGPGYFDQTGRWVPTPDGSTFTPPPDEPWWWQGSDGHWHKGEQGTTTGGDVNPQGPPGTNGPPQQEMQPMAATAPIATSNLLAQLGIMPTATVAHDPVGRSDVYPDFILQRLNQRRKGVQNGIPFVPRVGY